MKHDIIIKKLIFVAFLLITPSLSAQNFDNSKLDSLFFLVDSNQKGMANISIFKEEKEIYHKAFGFSDIENNIKANTETKYRIGSISKMFTASIIMQLIEEGKLNFDTKLSKFYPEIDKSDKITIENLLSHRSGIYNFTSAKNYRPYRTKPITKDELIKKIAANGSSFNPDEKYKYSNSNYVLLSFIAEKIERIEFKVILIKRICEPCYLNNTYYGSEISINNNEAQSYIRKNDKWKLARETNMSVPAGAGAIVSNPKDMNLFLNCLFKYEIISKKSLEIMMESQDGYQFGMRQFIFHGKKYYGHNGNIDGFGAMAYYFPQENVSIAYLTNGIDMPMNDIWIGILSIYFGEEYMLPDFKK